jgi:hypothetical protein
MGDFELVPIGDDIDGGDSSAVRRFMFRDSVVVQSPGEVVGWWERRRLPYNVAVGATGLLSIGVVNALGAIGPDASGWGWPPLVAMAVYGVAANVMFTGGWVAELALRPIFGRRSGTVGATIFRYGLAFSVGLTTLPMAAAVFNLGFRIVKAIFG